jgi:Domain of unknown function (DUF1989)
VTHDVIGTRRDPYTNLLLKGTEHHHCCHSNLTRARATERNLPPEEAEVHIHDVMNVFMCTGYTRDTHQYFMKASPVRPGDFIEFFAEIDLLIALSGWPEPSAKSKARADDDRYLTSRNARGLLPHYGENSLSSPSIALHDTFELGPPVRRHAEAIDNDVGDLIFAIEGAQAPIHSDRLSRRVAFPRPSAGPADDLTDNDRRIRIETATGHPEASAAVAVFDQPLTIGEHDVILEEL